MFIQLDHARFPPFFSPHLFTFHFTCSFLHLSIYILSFIQCFLAVYLLRIYVRF